MHDAVAQVDSVVGLDEVQGRFVGVIGKVAEERFGVGVVQGHPRRRRAVSLGPVAWIDQRSWNTASPG